MFAYRNTPVNVHISYQIFIPPCNFHLDQVSVYILKCFSTTYKVNKQYMLTQHTPHVKYLHFKEKLMKLDLLILEARRERGNFIMEKRLV